MSTATLVMFGVFVGITLVVTYWASGRSLTPRGFYTAGRQISGTQNGWAIAGEYISAATFLGVTGLIALYGFDGFIYAVGWIVAYLILLFLIAEPLRNAGKYTLVDVISFRLRGRGVRAIAALSTLVITLFYMIAQMVGAGSLIALLVPRIPSPIVIGIVGLLMMVYVLIGGMLATTWVQIIKAGLLLATALALTGLVLAHDGFSIGTLFQAAAHVSNHGISMNLLVPGNLFHGQRGALDVLSLSLALVLGTAGLPHILMRFFTVPSAKAARTSVAWAMALIGIFYITTMVMGLGAATIVGQHQIGPHVRDVEAIRYIARHPEQAPQLNAELNAQGYIVPETNSNLALPLLAEQLGGPLFTAFVSAAAFATILAVISGLALAASSAFAHDLWWNVIRDGKGDEREHIFVARSTALLVGFIAIFLSVALHGLNVAVLVGLAFAIAASANVPALLLALTWKRFSRAGAMIGMLCGLISSLGAIALGPSLWGAHALFPLMNPGIISIPLGFLGAIIGSLLMRDPESEGMFEQLQVRATTGIGSEI